MKTKRLLSMLVLSLSVLCFFSCDKDQTKLNENLENVTEVIVAKGIVSGEQETDSTGQGNPASNAPVAFTSEDIEWFNSVTREIKFKEGIEPAKNLELYKEIAFELNGEILFTAETVLPISNIAVYDLVLSVEFENYYRYYLHDGYPIWAGETEQGKENALNRAENWNKFLEQLRKENRLREYDDGGSASNTLVIFTSEDIEWFNTVTREIKFKEGIEPAKNVELYKEIAFELNGEILFTAETILPISSKAVFDLVLYVEHENYYRYYLHDGYPVWAGETEQGKENALKRAEGWNKFLEHLKKENRLREYDDGGNGDNPGGGGGNEPNVPDSLHNNTGDIELTKFIPKNAWNWIELEPNQLNIVRNENELKNLITGNSYSHSDIDFERHSLLLVRIYTTSGIREISSGLTNIDEKTYSYSIKVLLNNATVIGDEVFAVLTPAIATDKTIKFKIEITE